MRKTSLLFTAILFSAASSFAGTGTLTSTPPPPEGEKAFGMQKFVVTAGYGFGNLRAAVWNEFQDEFNYTATTLGPLHFRGEVGVSENVGLGISINHMTLSQTWDDKDSGWYYKRTFTTTNYLLRFNFHFNVSESLDPYFGIGAGYASNNHKFDTNDPYWSDTSWKGFSPFGFEIGVGMRYYFTPNIGIYGEIGLSKSIMNGGLAFAF